MDRYMRLLKEFSNLLITLTFTATTVKIGSLLGMWENGMLEVFCALVIYLLVAHFKDEKNWWIGRDNTSDK